MLARCQSVASVLMPKCILFQNGENYQEEINAEEGEYMDLAHCVDCGKIHCVDCCKPVAKQQFQIPEEPPIDDSVIYRRVFGRSDARRALSLEDDEDFVKSQRRRK